jgi:hypothetical protein
MKKNKILVAAGCSHTQGSAFYDWRNSTENKLTFYKKLQRKYGVSIDKETFIDTFTWPGILNKTYLNYKKIYNFGRAGQNLEYCIMVIRNYITKVDNLTDHVFMIQIPDLNRGHTISYKSGPHLDKVDPYPLKFLDANGLPKYSLMPFKWFLMHTSSKTRGYNYLSEKELQKYLHAFHNEEYYVTCLLHDLLYLQDYLISKGAKCFMFTWQYQINLHFERIFEHSVNNSSSSLNNWALFNWPFNPVSLHDIKLTDPPLISETIKKLNLLNFKNKFERLDHAFPGYDDSHFSQKGNEMLSEILYQKLDDCGVR